MYDVADPGQREVYHHLPQGTTMSHIESVPSVWDDVRDSQFFRIVSHVFDARVLEAASSLLGANDPELAPFA